MLTIWDVILPPIYLTVIFIVSFFTRRNNIRKNPAYHYYQHALFAKIAGAIILCLIYTQYYEGGDTTLYFESSVNLSRLFEKDFKTYFSILFGDLSRENYSVFDQHTGYAPYWVDPSSYAVVRFTSILHLVSFRSYVTTSILLASISFLGVWRLYLLFCELYPGLYKQFFYGILLVPSMIFWGSGILKDTYTLMGACWFTYSFYKGFIMKEKVLLNSVIVVLMALLILSMKPYIFIALLPGMLLWLFVGKLKSIQNWFIKVIITPILLIGIFALGFFVIVKLKGDLGAYSSVESILNKAVITQYDLKQEYNMGNSFDIGEFDASFSGILSKFPQAVMAGLYRPFIWEVKNIFMLLSSLENAFIMLLTIFLLYKVGIYRSIVLISKEPILFFSIIFSLFFAFAVGLTTSNFGALVRYKIPAIPFFLSALIILNYHYQAIKTDKAALKARKMAIS